MEAVTPLITVQCILKAMGQKTDFPMVVWSTIIVEVCLLKGAGHNMLLVNKDTFMEELEELGEGAILTQQQAIRIQQILPPINIQPQLPVMVMPLPAPLPVGVMV
jgi:hypothetical protein